MAYLGRGLDKISNIEVLDNITFDGSSSYSITKGSVAFTPNSAQSCLISIDGVVQATNFTVSSSTIDFGVAIPSTSVCNFFLHYGTGVMTVPSDGSVTTAKLGDGAVTSAKLDSGVALGKVLQVVSSTGTAGFDTNSTSYVQVTGTGHGVSITPSSTSSKIFISIMVEARSSTSAQSSINTILRDSTDLSGGTRFAAAYGNTIDAPINMTFLDSPNTTSQVTYRIGTKSSSGSHNSRINASNRLFSYIAMEIGA